MKSDIAFNTDPLVKAANGAADAMRSLAASFGALKDSSLAHQLSMKDVEETAKAATRSFHITSGQDITLLNIQSEIAEVMRLNPDLLIPPMHSSLEPRLRYRSLFDERVPTQHLGEAFMFKKPRDISLRDMDIESASQVVKDSWSFIGDWAMASETFDFNKEPPAYYKRAMVIATEDTMEKPKAKQDCYGNPLSPCGISYVNQPFQLEMGQKS